MFRLWFLYYYAEEKLALHRERSSLQIATKSLSKSATHSHSAFEHSLESTELAVRVTPQIPVKLDTNTDIDDSTSDKDCSIAPSAIKPHNDGNLMEARCNSHTDIFQNFSLRCHSQRSQQHCGSAVPRSPRHTFTKRRTNALKTQSSTWFHDRRYLAKRITLSVVMLAITFPCVFITSVFYLTRKHLDVNALDGSCLALDDARAVANVLTCKCFHVKVKLCLKACIRITAAVRTSI